MNWFLLYMNAGVLTVWCALSWPAWKAVVEGLNQAIGDSKTQITLGLCTFIVVFMALVWPLLWLAKIVDYFNGR